MILMCYSYRLLSMPFLIGLITGNYLFLLTNVAY